MKSKAIFVALLVLAFGAQAVPVSFEQAREVARRWAAHGTRFGVKPGTEVENVSEYALGGGKFFAVRMKGGTVFTAGDTRQNPVLAFTRERIEKLDPKSPLYALLAGSVRLQSLSAAPEPDAAERSAMRQWAELQKPVKRFAAALAPIGSEVEIDDVRVSPLLTTKWGQGTVTGVDGGPTNCFNFYTPPTHVVELRYKEGGHDVVETNENGNCVCGCVATAMAQLMRYWRYPEDERASFSNKGCSAPSGDSVYWGEYIGGKFYIYDYENPTAELELSTTAGAYDWANMVDVPSGIDEVVCSAIGKLTYDCGVAVGMDYNVTAAGGSSIFTYEADLIPAALRDRFSYADAKLCTSSSLTYNETYRQRAIFASLDARCPVLLLVSGGDGHAVVGDGYGFDGETGDELPYVHLNMGWSGQCDVWYNLPNIDTSENPEGFSGFSYIDGVVFNVFTNETGWIVSGRALDKAGVVSPGAKVTLRDADDQVVGETVVDAKGIYTFLVPEGGTYDVSAVSSDGLLIADRLVQVSGQSADGGNSWGNDLYLAEPAVQIRGAGGVVRAQFASLDRALMEATEDGDQVEILSEVFLRRDVATGADFTLVAVEAEAPAITRVDGATISITNGVAFFTNVVFALEKSTPVLVASNGVIAVAGRVELDDIASLIPGIRLEGGDSFKVAGELLNGLTIDVEGACEIGDAFGSWSCDRESAAKSAARIVTSANEDFFGSAKDNGTLVWTDEGLVDRLVAVARIDGDEPVYYRSLNRLFSRIEEGSDADIVVMKSGCLVSNLLTVAGESRLRGELEDTVVNVVGTSAAAHFTIPEGASLTVTNLTLAGYVGKALFWVNGGELALDCGATVDGAVGTEDLHSGAVVVRKGVATLREGSSLINCRAEGVGANGGAVWLGGSDCVLNLEGGWIYGCSAATYGGGVFAVAKSTINLSGASTVIGNESGNNFFDDIYLSAANCQFNLTGGAFGWVGVQYAESIAGNAAGDAFIAVDPEIDPEDVELSCAVFTNDKVDGLEATVSEDGANLVWSVVPPYTGEVDPEVDPESVADLVIYNYGTPQAVTNCYESFYYACASLTNDATIVVLKNDTVDADVKVANNVLIRADNPAVVLNRSDAHKFEIGAGGSLRIEDIELNGAPGTNVLLSVREGGSLTLGGGARIRNVRGNGGRAAGGIVVWKGEFRMLPGSEISGCANDYPEDEDVAVPPADGGVGGGLLVDNGTVYFEGGVVSGCRAARAGGVYIGNESTLYVSGGMEIFDDFTNDGEPSNLTVEDKSELLVTKAFVLGSIGVSEGINCNTNVFGRVPAEVLAESGGILSATNFVTTAACFHRDDDTSVLGQVVTNGTEALLVWPRAIAGGVYVDEQGHSYGQVFAAPCAVPVAPAGLVYNGGAQTGVVENAAYTIGGCSVATNAGQYVAVLTIKPGYLWEDGTAGQKKVVWSIGKATYDMSGITFEDAEIEYDGTPKSIYISGDLPEGVTVEYTGNGQVYVCYKKEVRAHFTGDAENYKPIPYMVAHLTVFTTHPTIPVPQGFSLPYNGQEQVGVLDGVGYTVTGNRATEVGNYTAIASLTGDYRWADGSAADKEVPWSIIKGNYDMSLVKFEDKTFVADGTPKSIFVDESTLPAGVSVTNYIGNGKTEAGTYQVRAQFAGDAMRYNKISDKFATMTITDGPLPPPEPQWEIVTYHPTPIAFKAIERVSDTEWTLVVTDRVEFCNYRLIWTDDLTKGFTSTGAWEHAVGDAAASVWTTNVITTGGACFWRAEGADGTNMVLKVQE